MPARDTNCGSHTRTNPLRSTNIDAGCATAADDERERDGMHVAVFFIAFFA